VFVLSLVVLFASFCVLEAASQEQPTKEVVERAQEMFRLLDNIFHMTTSDATFTLAMCDRSMGRVYYTVQPPSGTYNYENPSVSLECDGSDDLYLKTFGEPNIRNEYAGFFDVRETTGLCFLKMYSMSIEQDLEYDLEFDISRTIDSLQIFAFEVVNCGE